MTSANSGPPDYLALCAIVVTVVLHLILQASGPSLTFIIGACMFWIGYVVFQFSRDCSVLQRWGLRRANLPQTTCICFVQFFAIVLVFGVYGFFAGQLRFPSHLVFMFLLYPLWGLIQQLLALGIAANNLALLPIFKNRSWLLVVAVAVLFGVVHSHDIRVVVATFLLELAVVPVYLRYRNLWPIGFLHGWAGGLFYLWVLGLDMWAKTFGGY